LGKTKKENLFFKIFHERISSPLLLSHLLSISSQLVLFRKNGNQLFFFWNFKSFRKFFFFNFLSFLKSVVGKVFSEFFSASLNFERFQNFSICLRCDLVFLNSTTQGRNFIKKLSVLSSLFEALNFNKKLFSFGAC